MFVILDIKFRVSNIKWNQCQNTVKFQDMTSLVDKICTNIQTSTGYYLCNCVAVVKSHDIIHCVYVQGSRAQFSETYMNRK